MNNELSFGQRIDQENGLVECWFTHGALDEIKSMDLHDKNILMFGAGMGDDWLSLRCENLCIVERNGEWLRNTAKPFYKYRPCNDSSGMDEMYCKIPDDFIPDIIINDDAYRYEVCVMAEKYFKGKSGGGILITDNWQQAYVFMCPAAVALLEPFEAHIHEQADHLDNDGVNKWKTAIHFIK